jgi:cytochrome c biogenesis protein CcmG, thiol:disulfide interchange protein DsbE
MKKVLFLSLIWLLTGGQLLSQRSLSDVTVKTLDGKTVNLKEYAAKSNRVLIISFWATWCAPCKKELDALKEVYVDWQKNYGVELLAITIDNQRALPKVPAMVQSMAWPFTFFAGNEEQMRTAFNFLTIPQTFVVNAVGVIVYDHNGYMPGDEIELENAVAKAANKSKK